MQWDILNKRIVLKTIPFWVEELTLKDKHRGVDLQPYHRLLSSDWVTVLPITTANEAVLIWQTRAGTLGETLEIPGGGIDPGERDATLAAARELEEETGFASQRLLSLGSTNPNPATHNNRIHMFVALGCQEPQVRTHFPDESENIRTERFKVGELEDLVRHGRIESALSCLTIMLALKYLKTS